MAGPVPETLLSVCAGGGDFDILRDSFTTRSGRDVALEIYVDRGNLDRADWAMTSLKNSMKWDEERFGPSMTGCLYDRRGRFLQHGRDGE